MAKLGKSTLPDGHDTSDFKAFGPVATKDCDFGSCRMADLGCFKQDDVDSNKYYHIAVVQSSKNGKWFSYFEWGRTRPDGRPEKPSFQFTECSSEQDAIAACKKQFDSKNTKRGVWEKVGSKDRFVAKPGESSCYVVRPTATRMVGLPCAENIANENAKGDNVAATTPTTKTIKKAARKIDVPTKKLFKDLLGGAVKYANAVMSGGTGKATLPTQHAIVDAREILQDAMGRIKVVGNNIKDQLADANLRKLTYALYGMVPKAKPIGAAEAAWLLTQDNITSWNLDLDVFETALQANEINIEEEETDVMQGIPADVEWIDPSSEIGKWLAEWWGSTKGNHHSHGKLVVHNLWKINRHGDDSVFLQNVEKTHGDMPENWNNERPMFVENQKKRPDLNAAQAKMYWNTNTALLYHGSRTVNCTGIIREGFRFPAELAKSGVVINGAMFGAGNYQADSWTKSSNYCSSPTSIYSGGGGGVTGRKAFMFACDAILGHPHVAPDAYGFTSPPKGHHSVFGKANFTKSWGGRLLNNEWIIYQKGRVLIRYLAEISW